MSCSSCGRALASGAKCVYCAGGTQFQRKEQLVVPKGSTRPPKKSFSFPWKTVFVLALLGGIAFAVYRNPEWMDKVRELIRF